MPSYLFETREFGISTEGIHLLRSGYNYKTYAFAHISQVTLKRGKEMNNWLLLLLIGLGLTGFAIWYTVRMWIILTTHHVPWVYIEELLVPLFPLLLGSYAIYTSLRNAVVLRIVTTDGKTDKLSLKSLQKSGQLQQLQIFLQTHLPGQVSVAITTS